MRNNPSALTDALVAAYRDGFFPMANPETGELVWCSPPMRGVLPLTPEEGLRVPRSLGRRIRSGWFRLTSDACFERVIRACAERTDEDGTWIDERIVRWYVALYRAGHAHSVEAWRGDELVGGVYGVSIGGAFFGESMFSRPRPRLADGSRDPIDGADASKVALVTLAGHLHACGYTLFDTQFQNDHIAQFGVVEITREAYFERLREACEGPDRWRAIEARSR